MIVWGTGGGGGIKGGHPSLFLPHRTYLAPIVSHQQVCQGETFFSNIKHRVFLYCCVLMQLKLPSPPGENKETGGFICSFWQNITMINQSTFILPPIYVYVYFVACHITIWGGRRSQQVRLNFSKEIPRNKHYNDQSICTMYNVMIWNNSSTSGICIHLLHNILYIFGRTRHSNNSSQKWTGILCGL